MKSIDSIEKSLEERFNPKQRHIGENQLQDHDCVKQKKSISNFFRLEFSPSIPDETKSFLTEKLHVILDFPEKFGLNINHGNHLLRFTDRESFEVEMGKPLPKKIQLPASHLKTTKSPNSYIVTIIVPKQIDTAEVVVNITRNIFAKLSGSIFFNEKILPLEFYQQNILGNKQNIPAIPEILIFLGNINFSSKSLQSQCEIISKTYNLDLLKQTDEIKTQLTKDWGKKWELQSLSEEENSTIESIYKEFKEEFIKHPKHFYETFKDSVKQLNSEINFILPHEYKTYKNFEENHFIHYMRSVKNKLDEISSLIGFTQELYSLIKKSSKNNYLKELNLQIYSLMKQMRKEKKVIHFYVPNIPKKSQLNHVQNRFPLILIKLIPSKTPLKNWGKEVKRLELNYSESIYSKIYSTLHKLSKWILLHREGKKEKFFESMEDQNLKKLIHILKFKTTSIEKLQSNLRLILEISEEIPLKTGIKEKSRQLVPLDDLTKAWSYFISSVLTLLFYKEFSNFSNLPQEFRADNFSKTILKFVEKKCSIGVNHFHIVKLLWLIYEKKGGDALEFIIFSIKNPQNFNRYALHQLMLPKKETENLKNRLKKLPQFRDAWISSYQNRMLENLK